MYPRGPYKPGPPPPVSLMKGLVFHGAHDIRFEPDFPEPEIEHPTQVKFKPRFCGICGLDLHEYEDGPILFQCPNNRISGKPYQQCMGHEMCGEVVEVGSQVTEFRPGDQVVIEATGTCIDKAFMQQDDQLLCDACAQGKTNCCENISFYGLGFSSGGFAEYCVVDQYHCIKYDPSVIPVEIAALVEPLSVAWHAAKVAGVDPAHLCLVLGAGPIGLSMLLVLKAMGVSNVVMSEPAAARRELAKDLGAVVFDPAPYSLPKDSDVAIRKLLPDSRGFDRVYDCLGIKVTFNCMVHALRTGGIGTNVAIWPPNPVDFFVMDVTLTERIVTGLMCYVKQDFVDVVAAFEQGKLDPAQVKRLITAVVPIEEGVERGFDELLRNRATHIKVLISQEA